MASSHLIACEGVRQQIEVCRNKDFLSLCWLLRVHKHMDNGNHLLPVFREQVVIHVCVFIILEKKKKKQISRFLVTRRRITMDPIEQDVLLGKNAH